MKFYVLSLLFFLSACQNNLKKPSTVSGDLNFQKQLEKIASHIQSGDDFNLQNCDEYLKNVYQDILHITPSRFDSENTKTNWKEINKSLWTIRLSLRERLMEFSSKTPADDNKLNSCVLAVRNGFKLSRNMEDYLAENFSGEPQDYKMGAPKNVVDPKFKMTPYQGENPWVMVNDKFKKVTLRSGDIIVSRGSALAGSVFSRVAQADAQFSKVAFIFVEGDGSGREYSIEEALENPKVLVLESLFELGSTIRTFKDYIQDDNVKSVIFRYTNAISANKSHLDAELAHRSALWSYHYVQNYRKASFDANPLDPIEDVNHNVPYNFQMNLERPDNPKKLFNSQMIYVGFANNNIKVPYFFSKLNDKMALTKRMGITSANLFTPSDLEVDPRFEIVAEYRNLRKLKALRLKNISLTSLFKMMEQGYELNPAQEAELAAVYGWLYKQMDVKSNKLKLPRNTNTRIVSLAFKIEKVEAVLEKYLQEEENKITTSGFVLSHDQGLEILEKFREKDQENYLSKKKSLFHGDFKPRQ